MTVRDTPPVPEARPDGGLAAVGWVATAMSITMYLSYLDQIARNLDGAKGSWLQPSAATIAALLWASYGFFRSRRDWPLVLANLPGIVLGTAAAVTAL